jgi:hypothetical protein
MPVLLADKDFEPWLSGKAGLELLKPAPNDALQRWPVSQRVNRSRAPDDDQTLIDRISKSDGEPALASPPVSPLVANPNPSVTGRLPARADAVTAPPTTAVEVPTVTVAAPMTAMTAVAATMTAVAATMTTVAATMTTVAAAVTTTMTAAMTAAMTATVTAAVRHRICRGHSECCRYRGHESEFP